MFDYFHVSASESFPLFLKWEFFDRKIKQNWYSIFVFKHMQSKGTINFPKTSYQFLYSDPSIVEPQHLEGSKMDMDSLHEWFLRILQITTM